MVDGKGQPSCEPPSKTTLPPHPHPRPATPTPPPPYPSPAGNVTPSLTTVPLGLLMRSLANHLIFPPGLVRETGLLSPPLSPLPLLPPPPPQHPPHHPQRHPTPITGGVARRSGSTFNPTPFSALPPPSSRTPSLGGA